MMIGIAKRKCPTKRGGHFLKYLSYACAALLDNLLPDKSRRAEDGSVLALNT